MQNKEINELNLPKVSIIIINFNGFQDTLNCLISLMKLNYKKLDVVLVDNNSKDRSIHKIKNYFLEEESSISRKIYPKKSILNHLNVTNKFLNYQKFNEIETSPYNLTIIETDHNYGFAEGNNIGIKYAIKNINPKYILLLNNDTVVDKDFLKIMVQTAELNKGVGVIGPMVYHYNSENRIQSSGVKILWNRGITKILGVNEIDTGNHTEIREVDSLVGCALLAKADLFKEIGFLKKDYFAYWEEVDWCMRVKKSGYKIINTPTAKIWHKGGSSSKKISGFYEYYFTRNMFWFMKEHSNKKEYVFFLIYFWVYRFWLTSSLLLFYYTNLQAYNSFISGIIDGISSRKH